MRFGIFFVAWIVILIPQAEAEFIIQLASGTAHNFATTLTVEQPAKEDVSFTANYETHPWRSAPYYSARIGTWSEHAGWELELTHHKLYLTNPRPPVDEFHITNGYSFVTVNHAWKFRAFILRAGAGGLVAYPVTRIENVVTSGGYRLAGVALQGAVEKRFLLGHKFFFSAEGKLTAAYGNITLVNAKVKVPNVALHGLLGIGYSF